MRAAVVLAPTLAGTLSARYGYSAMFVATSVATAVGMLAMLLVRPGAGPGMQAPARTEAAGAV